ncbi:alpha 1,2-mannosyltransferase 2.4.1 [Thoreauomyces humboldtii]|nr:alpha 1,2-mannosyltransferase 2.4.1 [Thoreauomyces humboldtii]
MVSLPRGRTSRLGMLAVLTVVMIYCLYTAVNDTEAIDAATGGMHENAKVNRLLHQPGSPYSRADLSYSKKAGMNLVSVDAVSSNATLVNDGSSVRVRGVLVMLARNSDAKGAASSIQSLQERFNDRFDYPFVFLNDKPFDEAFKTKMREVAPRSELMFGLIPKEHWSYPDWIDQEKAAQVRKEMREKEIIYGGSEPYRHMCRYNSGFFYRHPLLDEFDYYWRVEPDVKFGCDISDDPFRYMQENNKLYGFTISLYEYGTTIETLWKTSRDYMKAYPNRIRSDNALAFLTNNGDLEKYNRCHFWSNFEIASLHLWRSKAYTDYFDHLDRAGGFFYERWGDAPVHSIGAAMILKPEQIHFFNNIGYFHNPFQHCPVDQPAFADKCQCDGVKNFDMKGFSCTRKWFDLYGGGEDNIEAEKIRVVNEGIQKAEVAKTKLAEDKSKAAKQEEEHKRRAAEKEKADKLKNKNAVNVEARNDRGAETETPHEARTRKIVESIEASAAFRG